MKEEVHEDLVQKVIKVAANIGVQIDKSDISTVHRIGKITHNANYKSRSIICRHVAGNKREDILKKQKKGEEHED